MVINHPRIMSWNVGIIKKRLNPDSTILLQDQGNDLSEPPVVILQRKQCYLDVDNMAKIRLQDCMVCETTAYFRS